MNAPVRSLAVFQRLKTDAGDWVRCLACGDIKYLPIRAWKGSPAWQRGADFLERHQRGEHGPFATEVSA